MLVLHTESLVFFNKIGDNALALALHSLKLTAKKNKLLLRLDPCAALILKTDLGLKLSANVGYTVNDVLAANLRLRLFLGRFYDLDLCVFLCLHRLLGNLNLDLGLFLYCLGDLFLFGNFLHDLIDGLFLGLLNDLDLNFRLFLFGNFFLKNLDLDLRLVLLIIGLLVGDLILVKYIYLVLVGLNVCKNVELTFGYFGCRLICRLVDLLALKHKDLVVLFDLNLLVSRKLGLGENNLLGSILCLGLLGNDLLCNVGKSKLLATLLRRCLYYQTRLFHSLGKLIVLGNNIRNFFLFGLGLRHNSLTEKVGDTLLKLQGLGSKLVILLHKGKLSALCRALNNLTPLGNLFSAHGIVILVTA